MVPLTTVDWGSASTRTDPAVLLAVATSVGFAGLLSAVVLGGAADAPTFLGGWRIASLFATFGLVAVGCRRLVVHDRGTLVSLSAFLLGSLVVIELLFQSGTPGFGPGWSRGAELLALFVVAMGVFLVGTDYASLSRAQWLFAGCFAVVLGLFWVHTLSLPPENVASRWPIWAGVVAGYSVFVIPRVVPERVFLWSVGGLSAAVALAGVGTVIVGEYSVWILDVGIWNTRTVSGTGIELPIVSSIFDNPNAFGLLAFAGVSATAVELTRTAERRQWILTTLATGLLGINAAGLYLSHSRASWLAASVAVGLYSVYRVGERIDREGRRTVIPVATAVVGTLVGVGVAAVTLYGGPFETFPRVELWRGSLRAIRASPSLIGQGHVSTAEFIEPYHDHRSRTPHNSYLSVAIRTGLVGAAAYTTLLIGGIAAAAARPHAVNSTMLAITSGWAVHHLFESYSLFQWTVPAVLSALSLGYLLFASERADAHRPADEPETEPGSQ